MRPIKAGVEVRPGSIPVLFQLQGERRRETLCIGGEPMPPAPENVDFRAKEMLIEGGNVYDEETDTTKTSRSRILLLSAPAYEAPDRQKVHTFLQGDHVFHDPKTGEPWKYDTITDVRSF